MNTNKTILLSQVKEGYKVIIKDIKDIYVKNHLNQIGITLNNEVIVSKIAPLGSPIAIKTLDAEIAIRKEIADKIEVQLI